jgi:hypothetical protein
VPVVRDEFVREWTSHEDGPTYFLYQYGREGIAHPQLRSEVLAIMSTHEPQRLNTLDYGLSILNRFDLSVDEKTELKRVATHRFSQHATKNPDRAVRYVALLFLVDPHAALITLTKWLKKTLKKHRKQLAEKAVSVLFGAHDPLVQVSLRDAPVRILEDLLRFTYSVVNPNEDNIRESGTFTPDTRDDAESGRNAVLKALLDVPGPDSYRSMIQLSRSRAVQGRRIRFRELARGMAERDTETKWQVAEVHEFERRFVRPIKSAGDLYEVVLAVLDEIIWSFAHEDASSRAVLETARNEDSVQEWLAEQLRLRSDGRYHVHREGEVAQGNQPDIFVSATTIPCEVAIEAKHGDKGWTLTTLEDALVEQLAEDYLRPTNRRHGVFVVTRHRKKQWRDPKTRKPLSFPDLLERLQVRAATTANNRVGQIVVAVRGIDAAPRVRGRRRRSR